MSENENLEFLMDTISGNRRERGFLIETKSQEKYLYI